MLAMMTRRGSDMLDPLQLQGDRLSIRDVEFLRAAAKRVYVSDAIMQYAVDIAATSRGAGSHPVAGLGSLARRWRFAESVDRTGAYRPGERAAQGPRICDSGGCEVRGGRRAAPPPGADVRSAGRRRDRRSGDRPHRAGGSCSVIRAMNAGRSARGANARRSNAGMAEAQPLPAVSSDPIRAKIEAMGNRRICRLWPRHWALSKANIRHGGRAARTKLMEVRAYEAGDEARLIEWKTSARQGRPMVIRRERLVTSRVWLLLDVGREMTASCESGEMAYQIAANALRMFAALSLRRSDEISLVFGDAASITRVPFNGDSTSSNARWTVRWNASGSIRAISTPCSRMHGASRTATR